MAPGSGSGTSYSRNWKGLRGPMNIAALPFMAYLLPALQFGAGSLHVAFRVDHGLDEPRLPGGECLLQGRVQRRLVVDARGLPAEGARRGREVRLRREGRTGASESPAVLLDLDHVQRLVVEHDDDDRQALAHGRLEVAHAHEHAAIAG